MSKQVNLFVSLILLGIFLFSISAVVADEGDSGDSTQSGDDNHNGISDQQEHQDERQIQTEFDQEGNQLQIQSEGHINGSSNHIQIEISASEGLKVNFEFSGKTVNQSESELKIGLETRRVYEFIDNISSGLPNGFDSNDTLLKTFDLRNAVWNLEFSNFTVSNVTAWSINASTQLTNYSSLEFQFIFTGGFLALDNNNTLAPNALKYSVLISNYTYSDPSAQLALEMTLRSGTNRSGFESEHINHETEDHMEGLTHDKESSVNFGNGSSTGFFSWIDSYLVDGVNESVVTSPSLTLDGEDHSQNIMVFSFAHGSDISWDPKVGVTRATSSSYVDQQINSISSSSSVTTTSETTSTADSVDINTTTQGDQVSNTPGFELFTFIFSLGVFIIYTKNFRK